MRRRRRSSAPIPAARLEPTTTMRSLCRGHSVGLDLLIPCGIQRRHTNRTTEERQFHDLVLVAFRDQRIRSSAEIPAVITFALSHPGGL